MKKYALKFGETPQIMFALLQTLPPIDGAELSVGTASFAQGMQTSAALDGMTVHKNHHKLVFILEGNIDIVADGQLHQVAAGDMLMVPAGEPVCGELQLKPPAAVGTSLDSGTATGNYSDSPPCNRCHRLSSPA